MCTICARRYLSMARNNQHTAILSPTKAYERNLICSFIANSSMQNFCRSRFCCLFIFVRLSLSFSFCFLFLSMAGNVSWPMHEPFDGGKKENSSFSSIKWNRRFISCLSVNQDNVLVWVKFVTTPRQELPWIINCHSRFETILLRTETDTHNCLYKPERKWNFEISWITSGRKEEITILFRVSERKSRQRFSLGHIRHDTEAKTSLNYKLPQ